MEGGKKPAAQPDHVPFDLLSSRGRVPLDPEEEPVVIRVDATCQLYDRKAKREKVSLDTYGNLPVGNRICGYGVTYGPDDHRNFGKIFPLPSPTIHRCQLMGIWEALEHVRRQGSIEDGTEVSLMVDLPDLRDWLSGRGVPRSCKSLMDKIRGRVLSRPVSFFLTEPPEAP